MIEPATDLKYTSEHEWVAIAGDVATVGITAYAAAQLGDVVYVDLPTVGTSVTHGAVVGEVESTKSVGELFSPLDGEVVDTNLAVIHDPAIVNADPFGAGWLIKVRFTALPTLLDADEYAALTA